MARGKYEYWLSEDGRTLLEGWARDGLTDEQLARKIGVSRSTLADWKNRFPDISDALKKGKEIVDIRVENALLKRALGYEYDEVMVEDSEDGYKRRVTKKMVLPDVTAQIFWLKNRRPDKWRDKPATEEQAVRDAEEQKARLENLRANTAKLRGDEPEGDTPDDGFLAALDRRAEEVWEDDE